MLTLMSPCTRMSSVRHRSTTMVHRLMQPHIEMDQHRARDQASRRKVFAFRDNSSHQVTRKSHNASRTTASGSSYDLCNNRNRTMWLHILLLSHGALALRSLTQTSTVTQVTSQSCSTEYQSTKRNGAIPTSVITSLRTQQLSTYTWETSTPTRTITPAPVTYTLTADVTMVTSKTVDTGTDTYR